MEIFRDGGAYTFEYRKRHANQALDAPILMLPSREQDYQDDYFLSVFPKAIQLLQESTVLVLVGYSLPEEDALLRYIIRQFCEDEADAPRKVIFYVDNMEVGQQNAALVDVFPFAQDTLKVYTHSHGFAAWAKEVVSAS